LIEENICVTIVEFPFKASKTMDAGLTGLYKLDVYHPTWRMGTRYKPMLLLTAL
jgi:hypothetical protein